MTATTGVCADPTARPGPTGHTAIFAVSFGLMKIIFLRAVSAGRAAQIV